MANRTFVRNIATLDNGLVLFKGTIFLSGSTTGSNQNVAITHNLTGSSPLIASGSAPGILTASAGVVRLGTGSYQIVLENQYVAIKSVQLNFGTYNPLFSLAVCQDVGNTILSSSATNIFGAVTKVGLFLLSGSAGVNSLYDPTGSIQINVDLALKNSTI